MFELASALAAHAESPMVAELKAGSEEAYACLVTHYHQPVYSLVYRLVNDPADAADTTQEVFIKVFRGIKRFHGASSLKTWIYRIAVHEASNQRRWWRRHKAAEISLDPGENDAMDDSGSAFKHALIHPGASPYENLAGRELVAKVEQLLRQVPEPFRTAVILRDLEDLTYEEIAEVTATSLGTVKSRLVRGREALRILLEPYMRQAGYVEAIVDEGPQAEVIA